MEGYSSGIYVKDALVISGTITPEGIKDLRRAFVVVDKGEDPENQIIDVGVSRVFKDEDGLAAKTNWEDYELMEARGMKAPVVKIGEKSK